MSPEEEMAKSIVYEYDCTQVQYGCGLLDKFCPGWADKINLDTFNISLTDRCVLGQLYGNYSKGLDKLMNESGFVAVAEYPYEFGFEATYNPADGPAARYATLQISWVDQIEARQRASGKLVSS